MFNSSTTNERKENFHDLIPSVLIYNEKVLLKDSLDYGGDSMLNKASKTYHVEAEEKNVVEYYEQALVKEGWSKFELEEDKRRGKGKYLKYYRSSKRKNLKFSLSFDENRYKGKSIEYHIYVQYY